MKSLYCGKAHVGNYTYFVLIDRFSNWPSVCQTSGGGAEDLILFLSTHFKIFGVPKNITSDSGQSLHHTKYIFFEEMECALILCSECQSSAFTKQNL